MSEIIIKEVLTRRDLSRFIHLPSKIHRDEASWLPPIYSDEWLLFDRKKNRSYTYADAVFFLAWKDDKPVGRVMGIINNRYNSLMNEKHGRFCFLESFNDREVVHALLERVERWAKERGMVKIVGPLGFSDKDPQGFQILGFEYPHLFTAATNSPYLPGMMEPEGYTKEIDLVNYHIPLPALPPPLYEKVYDRVYSTGEFEIIEFRSKRELKPFIIPALELMNDTFSEIYGFVPLNDKEKEELAKRYLPILDPSFIKLVRTNGKMVGFVVGIPDMSKGIIAAKGKFLPFGIFKILKEIKRSKKLMLMLGGITRSYRGQGIDILMAIKMFSSAKARNMEIIDSHLILENNARMRAECERLDGKIVRRFRVYQKAL